MPGPRSARVPMLTLETRGRLVQLTRSPSVPGGVARRARIVLLAADGVPLRQIAPRVGCDRNVVRDWLDRFREQGLAGLQDRPRPGRARAFPPEVELHLVRLACGLPRASGRSLSQWDCGALAAQLVREHLVAAISPETVRRWLGSHRLQPWLSHVWLHPTSPRDAAFLAQTRAVAELLTRPLAAHEVVLSLDEMTSLQPRPRRVATRPAQPDRPVQSLP